jgi:hypothetical protein
MSTDVSDKDLLIGVPALYWVALRQAMPGKVMRRVKQRMLILQGARDYQVTMADFEEWRRPIQKEPKSLRTDTVEEGVIGETRSNRPCPENRKCRLAFAHRANRARADAHAGKTVEELAAEQGVEPIGDPRTLRGDFWPQDESVDDFVSWLRGLRRE